MFIVNFHIANLHVYILVPNACYTDPRQNNPKEEGAASGGPFGMRVSLYPLPSSNACYAI